MIGRISGTLVAKHPPQVLVDVGGVGYEIHVPMSTLYQLPATGSNVVLLTHFIVREDAHQLYGFATEPERHLFRQLLKISGVGARTALAVLSGMSVVDLHQAVSEQDASRLTKIPGIGKKTAERLLLELRDKLDIGEIIAPSAQGAHGAGDIVNALLALGYNDRETGWAVKQLSPGLSVTEGIRQALKLLSKS
ncbi:MAG TPA: Holliday junction branch migration protein RuvA [Burkholderiales bacterium]|nr:Holliday junction branch migration protein RuvA [Burkholderiales bacterium]